MTYCEHCPLRQAVEQIDAHLDKGAVDDHTGLIIDACRTIFSIEGTDFSNVCASGIPSVIVEDKKALGSDDNYRLVCSDEARQGVADYLLSDIMFIGGEFLTEKQFEDQYPWISLVERLKSTPSD